MSDEDYYRRTVFAKISVSRICPYFVRTIGDVSTELDVRCVLYSIMKYF
jgi:hypothetical protein